VRGIWTPNHLTQGQPSVRTGGKARHICSEYSEVKEARSIARGKQRGESRNADRDPIIARYRRSTKVDGRPSRPSTTSQNRHERLKQERQPAGWNPRVGSRMSLPGSLAQAVGHSARIYFWKWFHFMHQVSIHEQSHLLSERYGDPSSEVCGCAGTLLARADTAHDILRCLAFWTIASTGFDVPSDSGHALAVAEPRDADVCVRADVAQRCCASFGTLLRMTLWAEAATRAVGASPRPCWRSTTA
jgi:hypothetical protein